MGTDLVTLDLTQLPSTQVGSDDAYNELAKGGDFLKYAKLYTKGKPIDTGLIPPGHWGIPDGDDSVIDLGPEIDVLPLARRPKALDTKDRSAIVVNYDEQSEAFKDIQARSMTKDSGCQHGISFLVFERSTNQFLEIFFGNKSSRPEAKKLAPYLPLTQADIERRGLTGVEPHSPLPATLKVRLAENKAGQTWHVPIVVKSLAPIQLPETSVVVKAIQEFLSAKGNGVEKVEKAANQRAR